MKHLDDEVIKQHLSAYFDNLQKIGDGGFSCVYSGIDRLSSQNVAIKIMNITRERHHTIFKCEGKIMSKLNNRHIIKLHKISELKTKKDEKFGILIEEKMETDLLNYFMEKKKISEHRMKIIFRKICKGVQYCHHRGIAHLDLKPENILLSVDKYRSNNNRYNVKLCDFGYSKRWNIFDSSSSFIQMNSETQLLGTLHYKAPELMVSNRIVSIEKADIWSLGVLLFSLMTGFFPFSQREVNGRVEIDQVDLRLINQFTANNYCYLLLSRLLNFDYLQRPSIDEVLSDPWLHN